MPDNLNCPARDAAPDRRAAVEKLYIDNFTYIRELINSDPHVSADTENQVVEGIAKHLPDYAGRLTGPAFQSWINEIIVPLTGFHAIRRVCQPFVRKAIWTHLEHAIEPSKYDDYPETVRELEQDVWVWVLLRLDDLMKLGTAKITTRVYKRTKWMTRDWMKRQRTRRGAVIRQVYNLPRKSKMLADKLAAKLDHERTEADKEKAEREEIQEEMKKVALMV